jgi:hypothetical protein
VNGRSRLVPWAVGDDRDVVDGDVRFAVFEGRGGHYFVGADVPGKWGPGVRRVTSVGSRALGEGLAAAWNWDRMAAIERWREVSRS